MREKSRLYIFINYTYSILCVLLKQQLSPKFYSHLIILNYIIVVILKKIVRFLNVSLVTVMIQL